MSCLHTFAICAYRESPYLEECIKSVINQTEESEKYLITSTPNEYISGLCKKYNIEIYVNEGEGGITQDWNYAISKCKTRYITITHQDDVYFPNYAKQVVECSEIANQPLIFFSDYSEIRNGEYVSDIKLLRIKKAMLLPLRIKHLRQSIWMRRRILSLGSPICCPSVAYNIELLEQPIFNNHFRTNEDWETWEKISKCKGSFVYCNEILMAHRIHEDSETTRMIREESGRSVEDLEMYRKFWPMWIAKILVKAYKKSEESNESIL